MSCSRPVSPSPNTQHQAPPLKEPAPAVPSLTFSVDGLVISDIVSTAHSFTVTGDLSSGAMWTFTAASSELNNILLSDYQGADKNFTCHVFSQYVRTLDCDRQWQMNNYTFQEIVRVSNTNGASSGGFSRVLIVRPVLLDHYPFFTNTSLDVYHPDAPGAVGSVLHFGDDTRGYLFGDCLVYLRGYSPQGSSYNFDEAQFHHVQNRVTDFCH